jgi:hypothetical protein
VAHKGLAKTTSIPNISLPAEGAVDGPYLAYPIDFIAVVIYSD